MGAELKAGKRYRFIREIVETLALTVLLFLVINFAIQKFDVVGKSMESRLHNQESLIVDKASYHFRAPARGDVVVFVAPPQPTADYIKRVIAVPGDVISVDNGVPTVDGVRLSEPYVDARNAGASPTDKPIHNLLIPPGYYFVMGDNRVDSYDSRSWGLVPRDSIIGRAMLVYWPLRADNAGFLPDVSDVYAQVRQPSNTNVAK
ncbi:signal peptidase I [Ktedonospora formicarum]|uniref:Signal peptidase I n=1 Tax=Ktedonospora formicarum TaxID=2778364 RepID=A0A8J3I535_9CHLR|nr:signal peptidase I [Ktedonospora formicarum]GHO44949.1 signal peptidase I [Ktedonospora formicarum]